MIDRQVYNHPLHQNYIFRYISYLVQFIIHHRTQNILRNPRIIIFPTRIFLTFIKLSYNKLISTRYLSDIGYLTFRSFDEKKRKKNLKIICKAAHFSIIITTSYESRLRSSKLLVHRSRTSVKQPPTRLILTLSKQFVRSTRGRACTTRKDLYHRIQFTEHNWPITSRDENTSRILSLGCRVTGRLSATLLFSGCAVMRDYSVCVR